jgi:outer membrane protein assembly factor BamB
VVAVPPDPALPNPLFVQALLGVPLAALTGSSSLFGTVLEPFTLSAFIRGLPDSGAGIGALSIAFLSDGRVVVSGGENRSTLWVFSIAGGVVSTATPFATLDVPVYDMVVDSAARWWATTGGGPLLQLDPATGAVLNRFGEGILLGVAAHPTNGRLYVSTARGVEIFDPATSRFTSFSSTRVHSLAFAPVGTLYGTTWPEAGNVVSFDARGNQILVLAASPDAPATGLAFGQMGTPLAGLLFVGHASGGAPAP